MIIRKLYEKIKASIELFYLAAKWLKMSVSEHESLARFHAQVWEEKKIDEKMAFLIGNSVNFLITYRGNAELAINQAEKSFDEVEQAKIKATEAILASKRLEATEEMDKKLQELIDDFNEVDQKDQTDKLLTERAKYFHVSNISSATGKHVSNTKEIALV